MINIIPYYPETFLEFHGILEQFLGFELQMDMAKMNLTCRNRNSKIAILSS